KLRPEIRILECPEYSPNLSWHHTPHRIIKLCVRWLTGVIAYYDPPDGIDERPILKLAMSHAERRAKHRMLLEFKSQTGQSLAVTHSYPDRFVRWRRRHYQPEPFNYHISYARFVAALKRLFPPRV